MYGFFGIGAIFGILDLIQTTDLPSCDLSVAICPVAQLWLVAFGFEHIRCSQITLAKSVFGDVVGARTKKKSLFEQRSIFSHVREKLRQKYKTKHKLTMQFVTKWKNRTKNRKNRGKTANNFVTLLIFSVLQNDSKKSKTAQNDENVQKCLEKHI